MTPMGPYTYSIIIFAFWILLWIQPFSLTYPKVPSGYPILARCIWLFLKKVQIIFIYPTYLSNIPPYYPHIIGFSFQPTPIFFSTISTAGPRPARELPVCLRRQYFSGGTGPAVTLSGSIHNTHKTNNDGSFLWHN